MSPKMSGVFLKCDGCHDTVPMSADCRTLGRWYGMGHPEPIELCPACVKIMLLSLEGRRCEPKAA